MHNGAFFGLDEVIDFYNEGGGTNDFAANKTRILKPLGLTEDEKEDLLMFLESLSGEEIVMEAPKLQNMNPWPWIKRALQGETYEKSTKQRESEKNRNLQCERLRAFPKEIFILQWNGAHQRYSAVTDSRSPSGKGGSHCHISTKVDC
jgi:hypothetical protein